MSPLPNSFRIVYFSSVSCSACPVVFSKIEMLVPERFPKASLEKFDVQQFPELAAQHRVFSAPAIILEIDGKEYFRYGATVSISELEGQLNRYYQMYFHK